MGASRSELYRADELKAKLSAEKTAHSSGLTVAESDSLIGHATVTDAVAAFMKAKARKSPRTLQAYSLTLKCFVDTLPSWVRNVKDERRHLADAYNDEQEANRKKYYRNVQPISSS